MSCYLNEMSRWVVDVGDVDMVFSELHGGSHSQWKSSLGSYDNSKVVAAGGVCSKKSTLRPRSGLTGVAVARPEVAPVLKAPGWGKE